MAIGLGILYLFKYQRMFFVLLTAHDSLTSETLFTTRVGVWYTYKADCIEYTYTFQYNQNPFYLSLLTTNGYAIVQTDSYVICIKAEKKTKTSIYSLLKYIFDISSSTEHSTQLAHHIKRLFSSQKNGLVEWWMGSLWEDRRGEELSATELYVNWYSIEPFALLFFSI